MRIDPDSVEAIDVDQMYKDHSRSLYGILYAQCCDRELAMEAVQESFLKLQKHRQEPIQKVLPWLVRVGKNWLLDRSRHRVRTSSLLAWIAKDSLVYSAPDGNLRMKERNEQIRRALLELKEEDRAVIVLRYAMDWDSAQIAHALECSIAAVDMRLSRSRQKLAVVLESLGVQGHESFV